VKLYWPTASYWKGLGLLLCNDYWLHHLASTATLIEWQRMESIFSTMCEEGLLNTTSSRYSGGSNEECGECEKECP
jgi:7-cyano-7-deazaguanine synthase in queuosine biosynthesis